MSRLYYVLAFCMITACATVAGVRGKVCDDLAPYETEGFYLVLVEGNANGDECVTYQAPAAGYVRQVVLCRMACGAWEKTEDRHLTPPKAEPEAPTL